MRTVDIRGTADKRKAKLQAVEDLRGCDHGFLSKEGVAKYAKAFGVVLKPTKHYAEPDHPKGLHLANGAKSAIGMDACVMAQCICDSLDVKYPRMMGRGFQLRVCCDALEKHFSAVSEWSGSPDPDDPDNFWIDDVTGERVNAFTGERTKKD